MAVINEIGELEWELGDRGVALWIAALPPRALHTAQQLPRWRELDDSGRLHPSALAALHAYRARSPSDP